MEAAMRAGATLASPTSSGVGGDFWSQIGSGFATGISRVASDLLPNWTAQQLKVQKTDQLLQPTMQWQYAQPRMDTPLQSAEAGKPQESLWSKVLFDVGDIQVTTSSLVIMTGALMALLFVFKKLR